MTEVIVGLGSLVRAVDAIPGWVIGALLVVLCYAFLYAILSVGRLADDEE